MIVKDLMSTSISTVLPDDTIHAVMELMKTENIGAVPVCDAQKHLLGIITDRDLIIRHGNGTLAEDVMTVSPFTISPKEDIHTAALVFSDKGVRRLPVVENDKLVGILSLRDLARKRIFIAEIGHIIYALSNNSDQK